jgi:DNA-binding NtrC family response regulator
MNNKILIVEDQFVEAHDLQLILEAAGYVIGGIAPSATLAREMIQKEVPGLVLLDIFLKGKETGIDLARHLNKENIPFIYLSANSDERILNAAKATHPYGFLVKPYREKELIIMLEIAQYRHELAAGLNQQKEIELTTRLAAIGASHENPDEKMLAITRALLPHIGFDYITAGLNRLARPLGIAISYLRIGFDEYQKIGLPELTTITGKKVSELAGLLADGSLYNMLSDTFRMLSCTSLQLQLIDGEIFTVSFYSRKAGSYDENNGHPFAYIQKPLTDAINSIFSDEKMPGKNAVPHEGQKAVIAFEGIVGKSHLLLNVFDLISSVAPADTSVLILGESGTGKERIADAIHSLSNRKNGPLVKVNCAALPPTLIESELFGHEKGSFTGALDKRIGKFEKANKGTIFLDEVGEMSLDLQVKLLRVLQEKYVERIGASDPTPVDVRVIAATNRNLEKEVAEGRFRLDLYYRLNVFPIEMPPLRKRTEDIPLLAGHFIDHYNQKTGKKISGIHDRVIGAMSSYHWPGNIRELENMIERCVLLTKGELIEEMSFPSFNTATASAAHDNKVKTIHENERDHIIDILKKCGGRIWGPGGAAELLHLNPTTLRSRMTKLGIDKNDI